MNTEIRDRLMQSWQLETEIETLMRAREKTLSRYLSCESGERVDGSKPTYSKLMQAYAELGEAIDDRIDELCSVRADTLKLISTVPGSRFRAVLTERYVSCNTWEVIAEHLDSDLRSIYRLHSTAMYKLEKNMEYMT